MHKVADALKMNHFIKWCCKFCFVHFGRKSNFNLESELKRRFKDSRYEEVGINRKSWVQSPEGKIDWVDVYGKKRGAMYEKLDKLILCLV